MPALCLRFAGLRSVSLQPMQVSELASPFVGKKSRKETALEGRNVLQLPKHDSSPMQQDILGSTRLFLLLVEGM